MKRMLLLFVISIFLIACTTSHVACKADAKRCSDGSYVSRTAPNCEFAQCPTQIANPASVYCEEQNGSLQIITNSEGSQSGICTLKDGTKCDEWAYFRGECPAK